MSFAINYSISTTSAGARRRGKQWIVLARIGNGGRCGDGAEKLLNQTVVGVGG